jgi:hypothetical protein
VPIFAPSHRPPAENRHERVHFVPDGIESCVAQAEAAAGDRDRDVLLHGPPRRRPDPRADGDADRVELQLVRRLEGHGVTHLRYRVRR